MGALTRLVLSRPESAFAHGNMENGKKRCHYDWKTVNKLLENGKKTVPQRLMCWSSELTNCQSTPKNVSLICHMSGCLAQAALNRVP